MKFAIFGNTYQAKKSSHAENLFRLLAGRKAQLCVCREFYNFLTSDLHLDIPAADLFDGKLPAAWAKRTFPSWASTPDVSVFWPTYRPKKWKKRLTKFTTTTIR